MYPGVGRSRVEEAHVAGYLILTSWRSILGPREMRVYVLYILDLICFQGDEESLGRYRRPYRT